MNDQVKELIAWRDEFNVLQERIKSHPGEAIYDKGSLAWSPDDVHLINEWNSLCRRQNDLRVYINNAAFFMIDMLEVLEKQKEEERRFKVLAWEDDGREVNINKVEFGYNQFDLSDVLQALNDLYDTDGLFSYCVLHDADLEESLEYVGAAERNTKGSLRQGPDWDKFCRKLSYEVYKNEFEIFWHFDRYDKDIPGGLEV